MNDLLYKNKYRIPSIRHREWDYAWNGAYFITVCTHNRNHYFGEIGNDLLIPSNIAYIVEENWFAIPRHFPFILLDAFIVMPNHIHGIIIFNKETPCDLQEAGLPSDKRFRNQGKNTLSSVVGSFYYPTIPPTILK